MKLLAIDGNSILNRAFYGVRPLTTKDGIHTNAIFGFLNILFKLEREISPDCVAVAFDVSRKTFRNDQYDQYKANRKGMPEELAQQLPLVKEILLLMGYKILGVEGFEGDDILGTLAHQCSCAENCTCVIATGDRDCLQLVTDNVNVSLAKTKENIIYNPQKVLEDLGIKASQVTELKALMGDSSDNIPGVKGIGEKTAVTLIQKYDSLEKLYQDVESIEATPRIKKLLTDGKDNAYMSRTLATICVDVPIEKDFAKYEKSTPNIEKLSELMTKLEMFSFFEKMNLTPTATVVENEEPQESIVTIIYENEPTDAIISALSASANKDKIYVILDDEALTFNIDDKIYITSLSNQDMSNVDVLLKHVATNKIKINTFMAKPLIKKIKSLGYDDVELDFDLELAAYLLNPNSKGYDLFTLANRHLNGLLIDCPEFCFPAAALPYLCQSLKKELEQDDMLKLYNEIELPLCEVLADMELEGFAVDSDGLKEFGEKIDNDITFFRQQIFMHAGEEFNINSTKELGSILFEKLGLPAKKKTKTGYSTNIDVLEALMEKHEIIPAIMEYRKLTKLHSTYVIGLLKVINADGRVHSTFNQTETRTGRISSTEPNVQNIPIRTKLGSEMRRFFVAREGYTLVDADYSQIELRILAHIANDKNMISAFENGDDIHSMTASQVFNCPIDELTTLLRSRAKAINFGIVYGIGPFSLSQDINVSVAEAKAYIEAYLKTYSGVSEYMHKIVEKANEDGYVTTLYGRRRDLAEIKSTNKTVKAFAERVALNMPIQGTAADIIKLAMIKVHSRIKREGLDARLILQVHDELIIEAPAMQAEMIKVMLKEEMQNAAQLSVPLTVDVHTGVNWYIAKG